MKRSTNACEMLEHLMCPAFLVSDGIITQANQSALQRQIELNKPVADLIYRDKEAYAQYKEGKLCLCLCVDGITYNATVTTADGCHVFCLESDYEKPELRAYALAAQVLREPLSNALACIDQLLPQSASIKDDADVTQLARINRNLHQLLRAVGNMSDAAQYSDPNTGKMQLQNALWVFDEILQKAARLTEQAGHKLEYSIPNQSVHCMLDQERLDRAVLNLISNAVKYAPDGAPIKIRFVCGNNRLSFIIENACSDAAFAGDTFTRYLRQPGIEDARSGIGLGLSIVRSVAAMHGGTVLMEYPDNTMRITMSIAAGKTLENTLRSPVSLPVDYVGGYASELVELSDCLPYQLFDGNM